MCNIITNTFLKGKICCNKTNTDAITTDNKTNTIINSLTMTGMRIT